ncbi:MAG: DUF4339 domain-containing protein [Bdellovibrionaceae bacterium]|nr:DUF4339 domain-containing protein [Pseudobdellovibrionaceae bacterium]
MKRWFIQVGPTIYGPIDVNEVENLIKKNSDALVWGKGMSEWLPYLEWKKSVLSVVEKESRTRLWQYRHNDHESKILKMDELVNELKKLASYDNVYVKSDIDPKWQLLFTSQPVTDKLGLTRRTQLRVPIFGVFEGHNISLKEDFQCKLITLSEGGCGFTDAFGLKIGHSIRGQLVSPNLNQTVPVVGDVVYSGDGGEIGLKFSSMPAESKSLVMDYITKFREAESESPPT